MKLATDLIKLADLAVGRPLSAALGIALRPANDSVVARPVGNGVEVTAPGGRTRSCYDLDLRPASAPPRIYAFYDASGSYILTQFPVIDVVPGDPGYSDVWEVFKVHAPPGFPADNSIRDAATVERLIQDPASGWTAEDTRILSNSPVVPAGSRAGMRADGRSGAAPLRYAWYRGRRAPFLYFEGSLKRGDATTAPVDRWTATSAAVPLGAAGAPAVGAVPGDTAYSPLHLLFDRDGRPLAATPLNCPIVGE